MIRFERSLALLGHPRTGTLTALAAMAGFYDHPHMLREWKDLAGCTPMEWLAEEIPSVHHVAQAGTVGR